MDEPRCKALAELPMDIRRPQCVDMDKVLHINLHWFSRFLLVQLHVLEVALNIVLAIVWPYHGHQIRIDGQSMAMNRRLIGVKAL